MATKNRSPQIVKDHLEAMRHELRHQLWIILHERVASPKEMADELDADLPTVSHHTKRLVELGCAELVDQRMVRGAVQHFYRATKQVRIDEDDWNRLLEKDPPLAEYLLGSFMQSQLDDFRGAIESGALGPDDRWHISRTPAIVDTQGVDEILEVARRAEEEVSDVVKRAAERRSESGEDAVHMSACLSFFKTAPGAGGSSG